MRKSFFSVTDFDVLKMESFGSEEHALLHTNLLKSQNFDEDMLVKPDNLHNSIQMENLNKIRKIRRHRRPFLHRFSFRISTTHMASKIIIMQRVGYIPT